MKHIWSIICKKSITDLETSLISLIDSVEQINFEINKEKFKIEKKVELFNPFEIVHFVYKEKKFEEEEEGELLLEINNTKGEIIGELNQKIVIPKNFYRIRVRSLINKVIFSDPGIYYFVVKLKKSNNSFEKVAEIPIQINFTFIE